jgi:hypothetical protein
MESLALIVAILLSIVVFSGPLGLLLTSRVIKDYANQRKTLWIVHQVIVLVISIPGITIAAIFVFNPIPIGTKLLAICGIALNVFALKREFFKPK